MKSILATTCVALFATGCASTPPPATSPASPSAAPPGPVAADSFDLASFTRGQPACFLVTDHTGKPVIRAGGARCAERFSPCSTFKIPNSIIGLETGVVRDDDTVIPWDQQKYPKQDWWPESWTDRVHDLRSAFKYSFVPYYRALATRVGAEAMQRYVHQFHYGNEDIGSSLDAFWLDGTIRISADEQVRFLRAFYDEQLGVSERTTRVVKDILVHERAGDRVVSAKTGTGDGPGDTALGWIVGYVEAGEDVHFYAFNVTGKTQQDIDRAWRFQALAGMLEKTGI